MCHPYDSIWLFEISFFFFFYFFIRSRNINIICFFILFNTFLANYEVYNLLVFGFLICFIIMFFLFRNSTFLFTLWFKKIKHYFISCCWRPVWFPFKHYSMLFLFISQLTCLILCQIGILDVKISAWSWQKFDSYCCCIFHFSWQRLLNSPRHLCFMSICISVAVYSLIWRF